MALVVAMAGMMLPAYSVVVVQAMMDGGEEYGGREGKDGRGDEREAVSDRSQRKKRKQKPTLDLEPRLTLNVERASPQVGSSDDKVERVVVVLVEREGRSRVDALGEAVDTVRRMFSSQLQPFCGRFGRRRMRTASRPSERLTSTRTARTNPPSSTSSDL